MLRKYQQTTQNMN